jgi:uncharacterized membrane protein YeaQ/YmgE (transglycosylase-associated protein family)
MGPASYPTKLAGEERSMNSLVDLAAVMIPVVGSVVFFAFLSVVGWAQQKRREREAFYRHEVLKKLIEQGGAGGQQVSEMMRKEVELRGRQRKEARILSGLITAVIGVSLMILLYVLVPGQGVWTTGLIPFSVGTVILLFAFFTPKTT